MLTQTESRDYKNVYTISERARDGKKFWHRIGAAFENSDGSLTVLLDALPVNGQLQIRTPFPTDVSQQVSSITRSHGKKDHSMKTSASR